MRAIPAMPGGGERGGEPKPPPKHLYLIKVIFWYFHNFGLQDGSPERSDEAENREIALK